MSEMFIPAASLGAHPHQDRTAVAQDQLARVSSGSLEEVRAYSVGPGLWRCEVCGRVVRGDRSKFRVHCMTHTGERPHACPHCPYRATERRNLKRHVLLRHANQASETDVKQV